MGLIVGRVDTVGLKTQDYWYSFVVDCAVGAGVVRPPVGIVGASCSEHRVQIEIISPSATVTSVTDVTLIAEDGAVRIVK